MSKEIKNIYILNHTHWDREWYLDFDTYRSKLKYGIIDLVDKLDNGVIKNFFFDGQTIIIEDVKEVIDETTFNKFIDYIRKGTIELGPWYILPDEFISDEESIIENIRTGKEISESLNSKHDFGYFPDAFGHIGQIPHLLNQFEMRSTLIHRGTTDNPFLSQWKASNGVDKINTIILNLREGYYQTVFHTPIDKFEEEFEKFYERAIANVNEEKALLIMNGCDHTFPPNDLDKKINILRGKYQDINIEEVTLSMYLDKTEAKYFETKVIEGEQKDPNKAFVLPSVSSTRTYLKSDNRRLIDKLTFVAEPFEIISTNDDSNQKQIKHNFKNALKNQPHDSILGCSIDEVVKDMEARTRNSNSSIDSMIKFKMDKLSTEEYSDFDFEFNDHIQVLNNNLSKEGKLNKLFVKVPKSKDEGSIRLTVDGNEILIDIVNRWEDEVLLAAVNNAPSYQQYVFYEVEYIQDSTSIIRFDNILVETIKMEVSSTQFEELVNYENDLFSIFKLEDSFKLLSGSTEINLTDVKAITDAGDSYNYSPINNEWIGSKLISSKYKELNNTVKFQFLVEQTSEEKLNEERNKRTGNQLTNQYLITYTYVKSTQTLNVNIEVDSKLSDIKIVQNFGIGTKEVLADQAFEFVRRESKSNTNYEAEGENNSEISYPQFNSIRSIYDEENMIQINHVGLNEWEIENENLMVTLLRNIGWLSRRDMKSRKGGAGPSYETPDAQGIGKHSFDYSIKINTNEIDLNRSLINVDTPMHQSKAFFAYDKIDLSWAKDLMITRISKYKDKKEIRILNPTYNDINLSLPQDAKVVNLNYKELEFNGKLNAKHLITVIL